VRAFFLLINFNKELPHAIISITFSNGLPHHNALTLCSRIAIFGLPSPFLFIGTEAGIVFFLVFGRRSGSSSYVPSTRNSTLSRAVVTALLNSSNMSRVNLQYSKYSTAIKLSQIAHLQRWCDSAALLSRKTARSKHFKI
jgi:hypothetical protein